jgi:glutamate carboxypeptidase
VADCSGALVFEPGRECDAVIARRKGAGSCEPSPRGVRRLTPETITSMATAIWAVTRLIDSAQRLTHYAKGATVNIGTVLGGQDANTVPDFAQAAIDLCFCTREDVCSRSSAGVRKRRWQVQTAVVRRS